MEDSIDVRNMNNGVVSPLSSTNAISQLMPSTNATETSTDPWSKNNVNSVLKESVHKSLERSMWKIESVDVISGTMVIKKDE